jgi:hypothetical protein
MSDLTPHQGFQIMATLQRLVIGMVLLVLLTSGCGGGQQFYSEARLQSVTVHIVGDRSQLPYQTVDNTIMAFTQGNEIWVLGKQAQDGSIVVNETLLGHEVLHILRHQNQELQNPDAPDTLQLAANSDSLRVW